MVRQPKIITVRGGAVALPAEVRERFGLREGSTLALDTSEGGIILRPLDDDGIEIYAAARKAEFLLNNAVDVADYERALADVQRLGVDPESIPHTRPTTLPES